MDSLIEKLLPILFQKGLNIGTRVVGVFVLWVVGRWLTRLLRRAVTRSLEARGVEPTLVVYADNVCRVLGAVLLTVMMLGFAGIETTTFAGLIAALGLAISTAWAGLLANFAAGAFLVLLRPFRKGDTVTIAGGVTGTVVEVGAFVTTIETPDNVRTTVGNAKVFSDTIQNFSANPARRVERQMTVPAGTDHRRAVALLRERLPGIDNVVEAPAPEVGLLDVTAAGTVLAVRPYARNAHYAQVLYDTNDVIRDVLDELGRTPPA